MTRRFALAAALVAAAGAVSFVAFGFLSGTDAAPSPYADISLAQTVSFDEKLDLYRKYDVLGIHAGMTADAARAMIRSGSGKIAYEWDDRLLTSDRSSPSFVDKIVFRIPKGEGAVLLAPPTAGNAVIGIHQKVVFPDGAGQPTSDSLRKILIDKYGPPSWSGEEHRDVRLAWFIGGECRDIYLCRRPMDGYVPDYSDLSSEHGGVPPDLIIVAHIEEAPLKDLGQAASMVVSLTEHPVRMKADAAQRALAERAQAAYDGFPGNMPRL